jgi:hypothetical protein
VRPAGFEPAALGLKEDCGWLIGRLRSWPARPSLSDSAGASRRAWPYGWLYDGLALTI